MALPVNKEEEIRLMQLTAKIPFDDRIHHQATLNDLNHHLIKAYLNEINSDLQQSADSLPLDELCRQMQIVRGPEEYLKPVNCGLLFFCSSPNRFFRGARIEVVQYFDENGEKFVERTFLGPLQDQLRIALVYIRNILIAVQVRKVPGQAEAIRTVNYPFDAVKEALANAVYHRSYEDLNPIEVNVRPDCIEIISFPGPLPPVTNEELKKTRVVVRDYRNRRIGDFLKELKLTEGRSTGIPKIRRLLKQNGSPPPLFQTDDQRSYFLTVIYSHPDFLPPGQPAVPDNPGETVNAAVNATVNKVQGRILDEMRKNPSITYDCLARRLHKARTTIYRNIRKLIETHTITRNGPDKNGTWHIAGQVTLKSVRP